MMYFILIHIQYEGAALKGPFNTEGEAEAYVEENYSWMQDYLGYDLIKGEIIRHEEV